MKIKIILITGGCGFIGLNLIEKLINKHKYKIIVIDNESSGKVSDLLKIAKIEKNFSYDKSKVYFYRGDILDIKICKKICKDVDYVFHLAAQTEILRSIKELNYDFNVNLIGTLNMLEASRCNGIKKFIFASSGSVLGNSKPPIKENDKQQPMSPYASSKASAEAYCSAYSSSYNLKTIILRFSNVYGPRSHRQQNIIPKFIQNSLNEKVCPVYGDGNQSRDFIYVEDLVNAMLKLLNKNINNQILHLGSNKETKIKVLISNLRTKLKSKNIFMKTKTYKRNIGEVKKSFTSNSLAKSKLNWKPNTRLDQGLSKTINFFLENRYD